MIKEDFLIDFNKKVIAYNPKDNEHLYTVRELYSFIQDIMDDPGNMIYDTPMVAKSPTVFILVKGWKIDKKARKHLKDGTLKVK